MKIPVYIIQDYTDYYTDTSLAKAYFDSIQVPYEKFYFIEDAGHTTNWEQSEKYPEIIINEVLKK